MARGKNEEKCGIIGKENAPCCREKMKLSLLLPWQLLEAVSPKVIRGLKEGF